MHGCTCDASFLPPSSLQASSVDSSDVTMWCQLASVSSLLGNLLMTRTALEQVQQNSTHCLASSPRLSIAVLVCMYLVSNLPSLSEVSSPLPFLFERRGGWRRGYLAIYCIWKWKLHERNLSQALYCNERYWPAIESLCTVLFALQDFTGNKKKDTLEYSPERCKCTHLVSYCCLQLVCKLLGRPWNLSQNFQEVGSSKCTFILHC